MFFGKINFIHGFIPKFVEIIEHLNKNLKKDAIFKWDIGSKNSFEDINKVIVQSLVLVILNYSKPFQIFSFASANIIVGILLQKNEQNEEHPISFMSKDFRYVELKYHIMEKNIML